MLYRQLSKLAVVGERPESPKANQSRLRHPTPYSIEHYRHEGVRASKDDSPPADSPRGRSQSSTWTLTRTRAPTPHPSATKSRRRKEEKAVQWTDPLEQESPEQKSIPVPAPSKKKSAMKRSQAIQQEDEKSTQKEEDSLEDFSEAPAKQKSDDTSASQKVKPCTLRRDRRSSIPRPKRTIMTSEKPRQIVIPERPLSPLIPPAVPAPLQLSHRQTRINAIPSSTPVPAITSKTAARDFSFDHRPEVITVSSRSVQQNRPSAITRNNLSQYESTSYLQTKPKRAGTTRTRPTSPNAERGPAACVDALPGYSSPSKPKALPSSASVSSFHSAKSFWSGLSTSSSCGAIVSGPGPDLSSKPALSMLNSSSSKDKDLSKTSMVSRLSSVLPYHLEVAKRERTASGGCSKSTTSSLQLHIQEHSRDGSSSISSASKSTASSSTSYHTAKSHLSGSNNTSTSNIVTSNPSSMTASCTSMTAEYIPTVQSELWNELMNFCCSDSSSVPPEERYCDCDDCHWSNEKDVAGCSTVATVGESRKCRARRA
ncbi:hypothetical protein NEUTE1DRAFT_41123 [Neurospora tetrasperma FGSC 2508]|uniref:Uncharacterized protein n=1 Tax=Neurospora tetrasperma (strain FGSC 2508 / ATCC MYA-4615 / P0657) TaxID=510951 RepID=F8MLL3_NEUT8|nr:uncharacterized protein NEUTE1DRAFT_41123 [Neurospora tetrasperma FGSC 2508]EGO58432.1 hypothetical protein NEUTE1DRAFT_41123 [Neurospora tetrasperma FGSC 2508]EGZ71235.1 hypothetical protein NEUTE2DRAFT_65834 [Neurospora tetrasperma FGSC 2509]